MNMPSNQAPIIRCTLGRIVAQKPPLRRIDAHVSISNTTSSNLTILVPVVLNPTADAREPSIFGIDTYQSPRSALTFCKLQGQANFWMFVVAAGAGLEMRNLPIQFWPDENAAEFALEVIHCTGVSMGDDRLSRALAQEPATGQVGALAFDDFVKASSVSTPQCEEVPLKIVEGQACVFRFDAESPPK